MNDPVVGPATARSALSPRTVAGIIAGAALMTLAAKVQVPFWPVPMTLHTMAVMGFAVALGPRGAVSIFLAYLGAGALGLPVFSGSPERGIGIAYILGPTGGYLIGYLFASWLVGTLAAGRGTLGRIVAMVAGMLPVYGIGAAWLATHVPADKVLAIGVLPFVLGDLIKILTVAAGALALPAALNLVRRGAE